MADKATDSEVPQLKVSDLDEQDLQKAIEKSIAEGTTSKDKPKEKTVGEIKKIISDKSATVANEDVGEKVSVVVKNRGYVSDKTKKTIEPTPEKEDKMKAPSEMNKVVGVPDKADAQETNDDKVEVKVSKPKQVEVVEEKEEPITKDDLKEEPIKEQIKSSEPDVDTKTEPKSSDEDESKAETDSKDKTPSEPEPEDKPAAVKKPETLSPPPVPPKTPAETALTDEIAKNTEEAQQKPTVFDTEQYHLPIKPRNKKYLSNSIAWTILALVFIGVGGYVMYRLGVIEIEDYKFW